MVWRTSEDVASLHRVAAVNEEEPVVWSDRFQFALKARTGRRKFKTDSCAVGTGFPAQRSGVTSFVCFYGR
jgi:hypothetical protein